MGALERERLERAARGGGSLKAAGVGAWRVLLFATLAAATWVLLAPSPPGVAGGAPHVDKLQHALLFAGLGLVATRAYPAQPRWAVFAALVFYGACTELAQLQTGRSFELLDLAADALGAATAFLRPSAAAR